MHRLKMDPQTPLSRTFATPSELPINSPPANLSMTERTHLLGSSPGLAIREREERRNHRKHVKDHWPRVINASACLQNALGIRNTTEWPTPPLPDGGPDRSIMEQNGFKITEALSECGQFVVKMDRSSKLRQFLDHTAVELEERGTSMIKREGVQKQQLEGHLAESHGFPLLGVGDGGTISRDGCGDWKVQEATNESPFGGVLLPFQKSPSTGHFEELKQGLGETNLGPRLEDAFTASYDAAIEGENFPSPLKMPGSFTAAICSRPDFTVMPLLSLTMKDVVPPTHSPTTPRCKLIRQFEVGLDGVQGIITGKVIVPESAKWTHMRESRLGKLGLEKLGNGAYSKDLQQKQESDGWGQGEWLFFGIKLKKNIKDDGGVPGKWLCFGAPVEAVEKRASTEQYVEMGGASVNLGNYQPVHREVFLRDSTLFCLGGTACTDTWPKGDKWNNEILSHLSYAMANVGLLVETLRKPPPFDKITSKTFEGPAEMEDDEAKGSEAVRDPGYSFSDMVATGIIDGYAEPPKRKRSLGADAPRKACGATKTQSAPHEWP